MPGPSTRTGAAPRPPPPNPPRALRPGSSIIMAAASSTAISRSVQPSSRSRQLTPETTPPDGATSAAVMPLERVMGMCIES